jgi:hypothetical protein
VGDILLHKSRSLALRRYAGGMTCSLSVMSLHRLAAAALAVAAPLLAQPAAAQGKGGQLNAGQCIVAGRLNADGKWAPRYEGVELRADKGRVIKRSGKADLSDTRQVRLSQPAVLTRCDGDGEVAKGDEGGLGSGGFTDRESVPALSPGLVEVIGVAFPRLRSGGELVELKVKVPLDRLVMVTR